jgi:hypothetical protein
MGYIGVRFLSARSISFFFFWVCFPFHHLLLQCLTMAAATGYDPKKTNINESKLANWLREQISGDLEEIPGIGPANKSTLEELGIKNTVQLIGKYLTFKEGTVQQHQDAMYDWLKEIVSSPLPPPAHEPFDPNVRPRAHDRSLKPCVNGTALLAERGNSLASKADDVYTTRLVVGVTKLRANLRSIWGHHVSFSPSLLQPALCLPTSALLHHNSLSLSLQGINNGRNNIILALAEKCDVFMQGIYDASLYE